MARAELHCILRVCSGFMCVLCCCLCAVVCQDLPHASSDTEWWYVNGHVSTPSGREFSFFASFFRTVKEVTTSGEVRHTHALTWAIVDAQTKTYHADSTLDHTTAETLTKHLKSGTLHVMHHIIASCNHFVCMDVWMRGYLRRFPFFSNDFTLRVRVHLTCIDVDE